MTFEQKKRLSIAVELAASPSVIFLDEPTSGLDARAALLVMNALRKICDTGRTVVATIHQPSSAVFDMFDDLLLLKKGGKVVYFGELGLCSCNLVTYFEGLGSSRMNKGENPATWMLNVLGEKIMVKGGNDYQGLWSDPKHPEGHRDIRASSSGDGATMTFSDGVPNDAEEGTEEKIYEDIPVAIKGSNELIFDFSFSEYNVSIFCCYSLSFRVMQSYSCS